jgi:hypothetical protein
MGTEIHAIAFAAAAIVCVFKTLRPPWCGALATSLLLLPSAFQLVRSPTYLLNWRYVPLSTKRITGY